MRLVRPLFHQGKQKEEMQDIRDHSRRALLATLASENTKPRDMNDFVKV